MAAVVNVKEVNVFGAFGNALPWTYKFINME